MAEVNRNYQLLSIIIIYFLISGHALIVSANRFKRDTSKDSEAVIAHLEKLALAFPLQRFDTDPVIIQKLDKPNSLSKYFLPEVKTVVYERNSDDSNKEVIVLRGEEDKLTFKKFKRIYVVLRKRPGKDAETYYFINLAFLRNANEKDTQDLLEVDGVKQVVEWVTFDEHIVPGHSTVTMRIHQCASSFLVPCAFNESALVPPENFISSPRYKAKEPSQSAADEVNKKLEISEGKDPLDNYDLYGDLDLKQVEGRGLLSGVQDVGILGGVLSGVGGVLCTIVSIIASCADERAYGNMMPPTTAAQVALASNPVAGMLLGRKRRDVPNSKAADLEKQLDYPGWKTQFYAPKKNVNSLSSKNPKGVFYGLGNCPSIALNPTDLKAATTDEEVVDFYLTKFRAQCISWMKEYLTKLIETGLLSVREKRLSINETHPFTTEKKLNLKEQIQLTAASELDAFTNIYVDELPNLVARPPLKSPDDLRPISPSVYFLIKVGLKAIERISLYSRSHMVHLIRHMLQNFKSIFSKLSQDAQNLQRCSDDCTSDKEVNFNDRLQIWAFISYIKYGLGSVISGADATNRYTEFYTKNIPFVEQLVNIYS